MRKKIITFEGTLAFQTNRHDLMAEQGEDDSLPDRMYVGSGNYNESSPYHRVDVTNHLTGERTENIDALLELSDGSNHWFHPERIAEWNNLCSLDGQRVRVTVECI